MPSTIVELGSYCFSNCAFETIDLSHITKLGNGAFNNNKKLKSIDLAEGVQEIPNSFAFNNQDLEYIHIPSTCTSIKSSAFYTNSRIKTDGNVKKLVMVIDAVTPPTIPEQSTTNTSSNILVSGYSGAPMNIDRAVAAGWAIYVPDSAYDAYLASNWGFYSALIHKQSEM